MKLKYQSKVERERKKEFADYTFHEVVSCFGSQYNSFALWVRYPVATCYVHIKHTIQRHGTRHTDHFFVMYLLMMNFATTLTLYKVYLVSLSQLSLFLRRDSIYNPKDADIKCVLQEYACVHLP